MKAEQSSFYLGLGRCVSEGTMNELLVLALPAWQEPRNLEVAEEAILSLCNTTHYEADSVIIDGIPHVVFEWEQTPEGEIPAVTVALDPKYLHPLPGWGEVTHLYEFPIEDPRPFS